MTRRDYVLMSSALAAGMPAPGSELTAFIVGYCRAVHVLADAFLADNPRFDRKRFLIDTGCLPQPPMSSSQ